MRSIIAPSMRVRSALSPNVLLVVAGIVGSFVLAKLMVRFSAPLMVAGLTVVGFCTIFFARPDVGLLITLFIRSSTDVLVLRNVQADAGPAAMLLGPNTFLLLVLILAGGVYVLSRNVRLLGLPGGTILALLLVTGLVGMLRSHDVILSFREWLPVVSLFVIYALAAHFFRTPQQIQRVIDVIAASFILPALYGFSQMVGRSGFSLGGFNRIFGTFVHPNPFAFYLAMIITLFTCQSMVTSGRRRRLSVAIVAAAGILLVGTFTRMAWAGTLLALVTVGAFRSWKLLVLVPCVAMLVAVAFPGTVARVGNPIENPVATGVQDRLETWQTIYHYWIDESRSPDGGVVTTMNRLGGLGPGAVTYQTTTREGESYAAHNDYIRVLDEYGAFGLTLYGLLLLTLLFFGYRAIRASVGTPLAPVPLTFFALTLAYMVMSITDNVFASTQNQVYYWALAGMTVAISQTSSAKAARQPGDRPWTPVRGTARAVPKEAGA